MVVTLALTFTNCARKR